ncbi:MAG: hypothetical protein AMXMBFR83_10470 [Phycisphaerae bacterium]
MHDGRNRPLVRHPRVPQPTGVSDRQLTFVHRNGQHALRVSPVGPEVRAEFARRCSDGPAWRRRLVAVIEEHAGPELLAKVAGVELRRGVLKLEVSDATVRYELGLRWQQRLLAILQAHLPAAGISGVRFVVGRSAGAGRAGDSCL